MHIADLGGDVEVLQQAQSEANELLRLDPMLSAPENRALSARVEQIFQRNADNLN